MKTKLGPLNYKCQELEEHEYREIEVIDIHENYQKAGYINDIAIITVDQKFLFKDHEVMPFLNDRNGLSSELYGLAPRNATKTYNNESNDNLFHFKVSYCEILHFSQLIAELLDGEIQKMTLYQIP